MTASPPTTVVPDLSPTPTSPPRRSRVRRFGLSMLAFVAALVVAYFAWRIHADRSLRREVARIQAAGEPILPADFNPPPVPDEDNAATVYEAAAERFEFTTGEEAVLKDCLEPGRADDSFISTCGPLVEQHGDVLAMLRTARQRPLVGWSEKITSPLLEAALPNLRAYRNATRLRCIEARRAHLGGQETEWIRCTLDTLVLGAAVDRQPGVVGHLTGVAIQALALNSIEAAGPNLSIAEKGNPNAPGPVARAEVQHLIAFLLDQAQLGASLERSLQFERAMALDCVTLVVTGATSVGQITQGSGNAPPFNPLTWLAAPLFKLDDVAMLQHLSYQSAAAQQASLPQYRAELRSRPQPPWDGEMSIIGKVQHLLSRMLVPSLDRAVVLHYRFLAHRRMAATALAIRLYEVDHSRRPAELTELVPDYLPAVPADSMSSNGVIQYLPAADPPRLYSVGPDGVDNGGAFVFKGTGGIDFDKADSPFFLNGPPPAAPEE